MSECLACDKTATNGDYCAGHSYLRLPGAEALVDAVLRMEAQRVGSARQALWSCRDGYVVGYTTERIKGGPFDGKFAVLVYKPIGRGARTGKAREWERVVYSKCATRKRARQRAVQQYEKHNARGRS